MGTVNLPTDLLRTFVTVIEVQNFTRAADLLGRSQPAISLQIKRLEELLGYKLIQQKGRRMTVSEKGEALAMHARQILQINDLALGLFDKHVRDEKLRVGLPLDYGVNMLQRNLTKVWRDHDRLPIHISCDLSQVLLDKLLRDEVDMVVEQYQGGDPQFLVRHWQENPAWVGPVDVDPADFDDLPLVAHPAGCVYRQRMTAALKSAQRGWEVVFTSPDIASVQQAVCDGFGFSCLTNPTFQEGMVKVPSAAGLPPLEPLQIGLFYRQTRLSGVGNMVADCLSDTVGAILG